MTKERPVSALTEFYWGVLVSAVEDSQSVFQITEYKHYMDTPDMAKAYAVFKDVEQDGKEFRITLKEIAEAFDKLKACDGQAEVALGLHRSYRSRFLTALNEKDSGQIDAYDAMSIVQIPMFGEVIYG